MKGVALFINAIYGSKQGTLAKTEIIYPKNVGASVPAKQHCQSSPFTSILGQIGQIGSAV